MRRRWGPPVLKLLGLISIALGAIVLINACWFWLQALNVTNFGESIAGFLAPYYFGAAFVLLGLGWILLRIARLEAARPR